jgi:saccharopepsin
MAKSSSLRTQELLSTPVSSPSLNIHILISICILGTSLIALPTDVAEMLNAQIGAKKSWNGQYEVNCSTVPDLPDLTFYFDDKPYPLKGTDYILEMQGTCISSFTGLDINLPNGALWIIGVLFILGIFQEPF